MGNDYATMLNEKEKEAFVLASFNLIEWKIYVHKSS